jgi:hypothetical protein
MRNSIVGLDLFRWLLQGILPSMIGYGLAAVFAIILFIVFFRVIQLSNRQAEELNKDILIDFIKTNLKAEEIESNKL